LSEALATILKMYSSFNIYTKQILTKKHLILVIIGFLISNNIYCKDAPNIDQLELISGEIETYYVDGYLEKAEYIKRVIEDAVDFYENLLIDTFSFELFVLDRNTWKQYAEEPFPLPHIITDEKRIIMPINSYFKIQLPAGDYIYGKDYYYFSDFIAIHELGHYISRKQDARSYTKWSGEFFADFIQIAYMHEIIPRFEYNNPAAKLFSFLPLRYKSLEKYGTSGIINGLYYHVKFQELSNYIYLKHGFNFMFDYLKVYKTLNKDIDDGKYENVTVSKEMIYQNSINNIASIEPDIFIEWNRSMRQTFHSWIILFCLVFFIGFIRSTDTSYSIFTSYQLKTKRIYKPFGIATIRIWCNLKNIKSISIKIKLIRISVLRIINCILVITLILCLFLLLC